MTQGDAQGDARASLCPGLACARPSAWSAAKTPRDLTIPESGSKQLPLVAAPPRWVSAF